MYLLCRAQKLSDEIQPVLYLSLPKKGAERPFFGKERYKAIYGTR